MKVIGFGEIYAMFLLLQVITPNITFLHTDFKLELNFNTEIP